MKRIRITKHSDEVFENSNLIYFVNTNIQNQTPKTICNAFKLHCTENHIFFARRPEKMVFPKKLRWNMIFLVSLGKMIFLFPENMILQRGRKMKDDLSQKNYTEVWYFLQTFWKDGLFNKGRDGTWPFLYYLEERWYFFPENMIFFPCAGSERWLFSRNTWKYDIFCVHVRLLQT